MIDAAVDKLRAAHGDKFSFEALLATEEGVITDAISQVGSWCHKTQSVPMPTDSHRRQGAHVGQHNTTNTTAAQLSIHESLVSLQVATRTQLPALMFFSHHHATFDFWHNRS